MSKVAGLTHYSLKVTWTEDVERLSNSAEVYFKVSIGDRDVTSTVGKDEPLVGQIAFSTSDMCTPLNIRIKEAPRGSLSKRVLGQLEIAVGDLLTRCTDGPVRLELMRGVCSTGVVYLNLRAIDVTSRVDIDVKNARQNIERIRRSADAADSNVNAVGSIVQKLDEIVKATDDITGKVHPYLNLTWQAISALYKVVSHQFKKDKKLVDLVHLLEETFEFAQDTIGLHERIGRIHHLVEELLDQVMDCCHFVREYTEHKFIKRIADIGSGQKMDEYNDRFTKLKQRVDSAIGVQTACLAEDIRFQQQLNWLKGQLSPSTSETSTRPRCLSETRTKYLELIQTWLSSVSGENILWLKGIAGSGKSTIAASIRDHCGDGKCLAAYLFFERGKEEHKSIIRSIAFQLATFNSSLAQHVMQAVKEHRDSNGDRPERQFQNLLLNPLKKAETAVERPVMIILDALDECGTVEQRREILKLLKTDFAMLPMKFRFLVTSRPENDIMAFLSSRKHIFEVHLNHSSEASRRDVGMYIEREMREAVVEVQDIPDDRLWNAIMETLSDAANGLFIWASTAIKMVRTSIDPLERLQDLLRDIRLHGNYDLDKLYDTVLQQSGVFEESTEPPLPVTTIFALILFAKESLTSELIDDILHLRVGKSHLIFQRLQSVILYKPGLVVRIHHASFGDYLTSERRSGGKPWFVAEQKGKETITARCLQIMTELLHFNVCNLETSFICNDHVPHLEQRIKEKIPLRLSYACRCWAEHLCDVPCAPNFPDLLHSLRYFAYNHLLYWFEVLSLTGDFNRVSVRSVYNAFMWTSTNDVELSSFLWDAYKLAASFAFPISQSAPHIYLSALSFRKGESSVCDYYSRTHPTVRQVVLGTKPPDTCIKVLEGNERTFSVSVSDDGRYVASGHAEGETRIWDSESGELALDPLVLKGPVGRVTSVPLLPSQKCVAVATAYRMICVRSIESGEFIHGPFRHHDEMAHAAAFSSNGKYVAIGYRSGSVYVWNVESGALFLGPLKGHTESVIEVVFSANGNLLASCSSDQSVRIWDARSGVSICDPILSNTSFDTSIDFRPDEKRIAIASADGTIRICDSSSGETVLGPLKGYREWINSIAFSRDGKLLVSGSKEGIIWVWDTVTGELIFGPLKGHTASVTSVSFFPDGKRIVSGSEDHTVRIWEAKSSAVYFKHVEAHRDCITCLAFSPNSRYVASGSRDRSICIWDALNGRLLLGPFGAHTSEITCVVFSPDGKLVASASYDGSIRIWDVKSGRVVSGPLKRITSFFQSISFSPDGEWIVSSSEDCRVYIWDVKFDHIVLGPLERHDYSTNSCSSILFTDDDRILYCSGSYFGKCTIYVWDDESGEIVLGPVDLKGYVDDIELIAMSPDGRRVVSGCRENTIRIWNAETGHLSGSLEGHTGWITSIAFSRDGKYVASGSNDHSIRIWDVEGGQTVSSPFTGHTTGVKSIAFSPCGRYVVSGSDTGDLTIRVWNVEYGMTTEAVVGECLEGHPSSSSTSKNLTGKSAAPLTQTLDLQRNDGRATSSEENLMENPTSNWKLSKDGWVRGNRGELLVWIPEDMRKTLLAPHNSAVLCHNFSTKLLLEESPLGENWCKGYP